MPRVQNRGGHAIPWPLNPMKHGTRKLNTISPHGTPPLPHGIQSIYGRLNISLQVSTNARTFFLRLGSLPSTLPYPVPVELQVVVVLYQVNMKTL